MKFEAVAPRRPPAQGPEPRSARRIGLVALAAIFSFAACDDAEKSLAARHEAGQAYVASGDAGKALVEFEGALGLDPSFAPAHFEIGQIHEAQGEFDVALARYARAVELDPGLVEARLRLGTLKLLRGDTAGAAVEAEAVRAAAPGKAAALALAAGVALQRNDLNAARALLDQAYAAAPTDLAVLAVEIGLLMRTGAAAEARARLDVAIALHPGEFALHALKLSLLQQAGAAAAVGAQLRAMIEIFPREIRLREALVEQATQAGDLATAEAQLRALAGAQLDRADRVTDLVELIFAREGVEPARAELEAQTEAAPDAKDLRLLQADFEIRIGERDRALVLLRELAAEGGTTEAAARVELARLLLDADDTAGADAEIAAALAAAPGDSTAQKLWISRLIDQGEFAAATAAARAALEETPEDPHLLRLDARAQELAGNVDLANDRHARAVRAAAYAPDEVERYVAFLRRTNRLSGAETILVEATRRSPEDPRLLELLAAVRLDLEDWVGAERSATALETLAPGRARDLRADALLRQQRFDESGALLHEADGARLDLVVRSYLGAGEAAEAAAFLDALLAQNPDDPQALGLRGAVHEIMGEPGAAEARYRAILARAPGAAAAHVALAALAVREDGLTAGEAAIRAGLASAPHDLTLLAELAQYRQAQGDVDEAIGLYETIYARAPSSLLVANNLASLLSDHRVDDPEALKKAYAIAGRLKNATQPQWRDTYAWTRHLQGEHARAREVIVDVAAELPDDPWVQYHAGMIHLALGERSAARDRLKAALRAAGEGAFPPRGVTEAMLVDLGNN